MLDIDDFAVFNDRFSFEAGDKLLKGLATHSKTNLTDNCLLARTGSEEFCVLINHPKSSDQSAKNLGFEQLTRFQTSSPNDISLEICLSIVVDSFDESLSGIDELISNSISAMAGVKQKNRGNLHFATEDTDSNRVSRHEKNRMQQQFQITLSENRLALLLKRD